MTDAASLAALESSLERAAEALGDITPHVLAHFYAAHPDARECFEALAGGERARLENDMVQQTLYCLMSWLERPMEIRIILANTVPHHAVTLQVGPDVMNGMIAAVCTTVLGTIPAHAEEELAVWQGLNATLAGAVIESAA